MRRRLVAIGLVALFLPGLFFPSRPLPAVEAVVVATRVADNDSCRDSNGDGLIVYQHLHFDTATPDSSELTGASFIVVEPGGAELHRIELSDFSLTVPLGVGCHVLVNDPGQGPLLVDAGAGVVRQLLLPPVFDDTVFPANWWRRTYRERRWGFLFDGMPQHGILLDTRSGHTDDLAALVGILRGDSEDRTRVYFVSAELNADESAFLLSTDRDTWVVPANNLLNARQIQHAVGGQAWFSDDGRRILSVQRDQADVTSVVIEGIDGSDRTVVASGGGFTHARWVPGADGSEVVVVQSGSISLMTLPDGDPQVLMSLPADAIAAVHAFSPTGRQVLFRNGAGDDTAWLWVDLDARSGQQVTELDGHPIPFGIRGPGMRWLTFFPTDRPVVEPGMALSSLDMESGTVSRPLVFGGDEPYPGLNPVSAVPTSPDGRYVILNDLGHNYPGFWLLDAERGTSQRFDGWIASGVSPSGDDLLVAERVSTSMPPRWRLFLLSIAGQELGTLAETTVSGGYWLPFPYSR